MTIIYDRLAFLIYFSPWIIIIRLFGFIVSFFFSEDNDLHPHVIDQLINLYMMAPSKLILSKK